MILLLFHQLLPNSVVIEECVLVCGYGHMSAFGNVLTDALPPQLSPQDSSGAKTGWSWVQEHLFSVGNRSRALTRPPF